HLRGHIALAAELATWVTEETGFTLAATPSLGLVCLRLDSDERTSAALAQVNASGRAFLTHTVVDGHVVIRVAIGGVTTERAHVVALWEQLRKAASAV
ncbi:MAG: aspartate aminotransferase family protein, partial [Pseudonocardia sp.]|nr:aspartate aminotransferase family protein [Pseudonocardia sp.]